jgi:hypothetical protein
VQPVDSVWEWWPGLPQAPALYWMLLMGWSLLAVPERGSLQARRLQVPERTVLPDLDLPVALQLECQPADFQHSAALCDTPLERRWRTTARFVGLV